MVNYNGYSVEDLSYFGITIKKLEIFGNSTIEKNEVIKKTENAVKKFLNTNKDIDYLIAYYYPTREDLKNKVALCSLILRGDKKNIDLADIQISHNITWNEEYRFFNSTINYRMLSDYQILQEATTMLQIVEEAYFIIYDLWITANYKELSEINNYEECIINWILKATRIDKECSELKLVFRKDFMDFVSLMKNILQHSSIDSDKTVRSKEKREWIFNQELTHARDTYEFIHQKLTSIIRIYSIATTPNDDFLDLFLKYGG